MKQELKSENIKTAFKVCQYAQGNFDWSALRSLADSLTNDVEDLVFSSNSINAQSAIMYVHKDRIKAVTQYPKYGTIAQTIKHFNTKGLRQKARAELRIRLPYITYKEQLQVIQTMIDGAKVDRYWVCRFYRENWDVSQLPVIIKLYEKYKESDAAYLVVRHAPVEYIKAHEADLIWDVSYLQVRLRYKSKEPILADRLTALELLYLFAKQQIDVNRLRQCGYGSLEEMVKGMLLDAYHKNYYDGKNFGGLLSLNDVRMMNWCLGKLHQTNLILKIIDLDRITKLHANDDTPHIIDTLIDEYDFGK